MHDMNRIDQYIDLDNKENVERLRKAFIKLTEKAIEPDQKYVIDIETALIIRDRVFFETLLKVIDSKEKELNIVFTPAEKNYLIKKMKTIVTENPDQK